MYVPEIPFLQAAGLRALAARQLAQTPPKDASRQQAYRLLHKARRLELASAFSLAPCASLELNAWCAAVMDAAARVCPVRAFALRVCPAPVPLPVGGRASVLTAALLQLIGNSLRHGGPQPALEIRLQAAHGRALVFLADSGPGPVDPVRPGFGFQAAAAFARQAGGAFAVRTGGPGFVCGFSLPLCHELAPAPPPCPEDLVADRFSPLYLHLCPLCILPD